MIFKKGQIAKNKETGELEEFDGEKWVRKLSTGENILGGVRSALEGQTFNFSDEIGTGVASLAGKIAKPEMDITDIYRGMKDTYDQQQGAYKAQNPKSDLASGFAGGLMSTVPLASKMLKSDFGLMHPYKTITGLGGTGGIVSGAGSAKDLESMPKDMAITGLISSILSPFLMLMGGSSSKVVDQIKDKLRFETPTSESARVVGDYIGRDNDTAQGLLDKAKELGDQATLADVGGANVEGLSGAMISKSSNAQNDAVNFLTDRKTGSFDRLMGSLESLTGESGDFFASMMKRQQARKAEASPLYKQAYSKSLPEHTVKGLYGKIESLSSNILGTDSLLKKFYKGKGDDKQLITSVEDLHILKQRYGDEWMKSRAKKPSKALAYKKMYDEINNVLKQNFPNSYGKATKIWANDTANMEAQKQGRRILLDDADEVAYNIANKSDSEKASYIEGAVRAIKDKMMKPKATGDASTSLGSRDIQAKIKNAFNNDKDYNAFIQKLKAEGVFTDTSNKAIGNSMTAKRMQANKEVDEMLGSDNKAGELFSTVKTHLAKYINIDKTPRKTIELITRLLYKPVSQLTANEKKMLLKHGMTPKNLDKIRGDISSASGMSGVNQIDLNNDRK